MTTHLQPTRRALVQGSAWAVPAIALASASPAFAASSACTLTYTVNWGARNASNQPLHGTPPSVQAGATNRVAWSVTPTVTSTSTIVSTPPTMQMTVITEMLLGGYQATNNVNSLDVANGHFIYQPLNQNTGGTTSEREALKVTGAALKFATRGTSNAAATGDLNAGYTNMRIRLEFTRPVKNLAFTLTDIDNNSADQQDHVWVESINGQAPTFSTVTPTGATYNRTAAGKGAATAWRGSSSADNDSVSGNLRILAGEQAVSNIELRFGNHHASTSTTRSNTLNLGTVTFQTVENVCAP